MLIVLFILVYVWYKYRPNPQYIKKSKMWICFYNSNNERKYFILWKEQ